MSTVLFILAMFAFICGLSFLLGGVVGMVDFETPQPPRTFFLRALDLIATGGLFLYVQSVRKNWKARTYERHIILGGIFCLAFSVILALIAFRIP
jgi:hypothetical protein